jgi:hypothetical protein
VSRSHAFDGNIGCGIKTKGAEKRRCLFLVVLPIVGHKKILQLTRRCLAEPRGELTDDGQRHATRHETPN